MVNSTKQNIFMSLARVSSIVGIFMGFVFLSPNITGNAVSNLTNSANNLVGVLFLMAGFVQAFLVFRKR